MYLIFFLIFIISSCKIASSDNSLYLYVNSIKNNNIRSYTFGDYYLVNYDKISYYETEDKIYIKYNKLMTNTKSSTKIDIFNENETALPPNQILSDLEENYYYDKKQDNLYIYDKDIKILLLKGPIKNKTTWKRYFKRKDISRNGTKVKKLKLSCGYSKIYYDSEYGKKCFDVKCNARDTIEETKYCYGIGIISLKINDKLIMKLNDINEARK